MLADRVLTQAIMRLAQQQIAARPFRFRFSTRSSVTVFGAALHRGSLPLDPMVGFGKEYGTDRDFVN
jgi:hypothetical protein